MFRGRIMQEAGRETIMSQGAKRTSIMEDGVQLQPRARTTSMDCEELPFAKELGLIDDDVLDDPLLPEDTGKVEVPIRRLSYSVMAWLEQKGLLMAGWEKYPHTVLDFSAELFNLVTVQPSDFRFRRKEFEEKATTARQQRFKTQEQEFIVGKVTMLNLDKNQLRDADFEPAKDVGICSNAFSSLRTLSLSNNLLAYPMLMLPRLKHLDLSHNRLIQVPQLSGLASLETLLLSHNRITELDVKCVRGKVTHLRVLDLRFNRLEVMPKTLLALFDEMAHTSQLHTLRLSENPFCCLFPEYIMLAVLCMPRLRRLDKLALGGATRQELLKCGQEFFGMALSNYVTADGKLLEAVNSVNSFPESSTTERLPEVNRLLQRRRGIEVSSIQQARVFFLQDRVEDLESEIHERKQVAFTGGLGGRTRGHRAYGDGMDIPLLSSMIAELDSAIAGHTLIINSSTIVFQKASQLASLPPEKVDHMFEDIKVKPNMKTGRMDPNGLRAAREDASKTFSEQICMLAERHPDMRTILIRTLAKCGSIPNEVGPPCLNCMALLAQADEDTRKSVFSVVQEIIVPSLPEGQHMQDAAAQQLLQAVATPSGEGLEGGLAQESMGGLQHKRLEELDEEEVQQLLQMLDPGMVESAERLLGAVLCNLKHFLEKGGEAADKFRTNHIKSVIDRTFAILAMNSARETFGNPSEEEQKITLSEHCVQVLVTASAQPLLRKYLRGEAAKDFQKMLKDHETLDLWRSRDVNMELTWTGRHLDLLLSCLNTASPVCLRNDMKQAFRVFHRIANVMAGVGDTEQAWTAEERAAEETVMWNEKLMRQEANLLDDTSYEDQLQQQLIFFSFSGIERMVHFLEMPPEDGADHSEDHPPWMGKSDRSVAVELKQQARAYLEELLGHVEGADNAAQQHACKLAMREEPETVEIEDTEIPKLGSKGGELLRQVFELEGCKQGYRPANDDPVLASAQVHSELPSYVGQAGSAVGTARLLDDLFRRAHTTGLWSTDPCPSSLPSVPRLLQRTDSFFMPGSPGLVRCSFFVSALLRTMFAALTLPTTEAVSGLVNFRLRNPEMQLRLVALIEKCGYVDCHLAAKLMRILSMVLRLHPDESVLRLEENDCQHCIGLVIAAGLAGRALELLSPLMKHLGTGFELEPANLVLAREAVRLINTIASTVSCLRFSKDTAIQKSALEAMVLGLVPMPTIKAIVMLLLYDMQVNAGSMHGKSITKDLALRTIRWQDLHGLCSETLAQLLYLAPSIRYEALELMHQHKVLGQKQLHTSFISALLDRSEIKRLRFAFELLLPELEGHHGEKVLQLAWAEMPEEGTRNFFAVALGFVRTGGARLLALTNKRLIILGQSRHGAAKRPCGLCPPESFCPIGPAISKSYSYSEFTRIYSSSDEQLLILGRLEKSMTDVNEKFDVIIFHQSDSQKEFKERLMTLSGLDPSMRTKIQQEMLVNKTAKSKTASRIARTTWAFREVDEGERLSLFVLTELNFFEFQVNFSLWIPNSVDQEKAYVSDNEYEGGESDDDLHQTAGAQSALGFTAAMAAAEKRAKATKFMHERRALEEPILTERASERQSRRYQAPPNEWLLDGIRTGAKTAS
ncbi:unnamed protein product, partial [Effrenium voratum]